MFIFGRINNLLGMGGGSLNPKKKFFLGSPGAGSGVNNRIVFDNGIDLTGDFTVSFYGMLADQENTDPARSGICGNKDDYGALGTGGRISFYNGHSLNINANSAPAYSTFTYTGNLEDTASEIVIVRSGSTITLYKNNTSIGTTTLSGTLSNINMVMGNPANSSWTGFCGMATTIRIYTKALNSAERLINQNGGHVADSCELWYDGTHNGDTVIDKSGNGRHGTVSNHDSNTFFQSSKTLSNLVSNGGFSAFTAGDLDYWDDQPAHGTDPANYIEENLGRVRFVSDGGSTVVGIRRTGALEIGKKYKALLYIGGNTSGGCYIYNNTGNTSQNYNSTTGWKVWDFTATSTYAAVYRVSGAPAEDLIISNIQYLLR